MKTYRHGFTMVWVQFFVYFEGLFSEHGLPSALRKVLGFFSLLVGLDQLSFLFWEH